MLFCIQDTTEDKMLEKEINKAKDKLGRLIARNKTCKETGKHWYRYTGQIPCTGPQLCIHCGKRKK